MGSDITNTSSCLIVYIKNTTLTLKPGKGNHHDDIVSSGVSHGYYAPGADVLLSLLRLPVHSVFSLLSALGSILICELRPFRLRVYT